MTPEQLQQVRELVSALDRAPGCAWCGNRAFAYISFGPGEQAGDCCYGCAAMFRADERKYTVVAEHEAVTADAAPALTALLAAHDALVAELATEREMRQAAEANNTAVAALCRGEKDTPCVMHVSAPILRVVAVVEAAKEVRDIEARIDVLEAQQRVAQPFVHDAVTETALDAELGEAYSDLYAARVALDAALKEASDAEA